MSRRTRVGSFPLLLRHFADGAGTSVLVALLILATVFAVAVVPRALTLLGTQELQHRVAALSPVQRDFGATGVLGAKGLNPPVTAEEIFGPVGSSLDRLADDLDQPLADAFGAPDWAVFTPNRRIGRELLTALQVQPSIAIAVDLRWQERITMVDGRLPTAWTGNENDELPAEQRPPVEFVLPVESAAMMELAIGDVVGWSPAPLMLVGTYELTDPDDPYWLHASALALATESFTPSGHLATGAGFVDPGTAVGMFPTFRDSTLRAWYPINAGTMEFAEAPELIGQIASLEAIGDTLPSGETLTLRTGMGDTIEDAVRAVAAVAALLALAISGPLGVILAVYAIGVQAVIRRRSRTLALASARGASPLQLRGALALEGIVLGVPAAAVGILLAAALLPGPTGWGELVLPVALGVIPAVLFAVFGSSRSFRAVRSDPLRAGPRRWLVEAIVGGLAALSLFLLFRRGLAGTSETVGIDPLLAATPLLLSLAVCLLVLRILPLPLRGLAGWMRRRPGAIGLLGTARAVREPALGFTAALALVVGISVAVFSAVLSTTVAASLQSAAADEVGADVQVVAPRLGESVVNDVAALDGVASIARVQNGGRAQLTIARYSADVLVVFTDTAELAQQRPGALPSGMDAAGAVIPLLVSADLDDRIREGDVSLDGVPAQIAGVMPAGFLPGTDGLWVLVDSAFAPRLVDSGPETQRLLIGAAPGIQPPALAEAVSEIIVAAQQNANASFVTVTDRVTVLTQNERAPVVIGVRVALVLASAGALLLSALTVVLASVSATAARHRILGVLRVLGTTTRKLRGLLAWELAPVAVLAIVAGTMLGLGLPWLVTAAVDLRPFVGGAETPRPVVDPVLIAGVIAVFAVVVALAGALAVAIGRRQNPDATLRMGAE